jgi:manganese/zinc/iron transport system permease protein
VVGLVFVEAFLFAPDRGLVAGGRLRSRQRWLFAQRMLAVHLISHEGTSDAELENRNDHLVRHLRWAPGFAESAVARAEGAGLVRRQGALLELTDEGRRFAEGALSDT